MRNHVYIRGDFNIDLLKINQKHHYNAFYENLVTAGYLLRINLPTRITDHSATLLDNIFTNVFEEHTSGVIVNSISDHQMIYTYKNVEIQHTRSCTNRYIEIERNDRHSIQNFVTKFQDFNSYTACLDTATMWPLCVCASHRPGDVCLFSEL